jgi:hypothetical protein
MVTMEQIDGFRGAIGDGRDGGLLEQRRGGDAAAGWDVHRAEQIIEQLLREWWAQGYRDITPARPAFVVRVRGVHYDGGREVTVVGWLTKDGACSSSRAQARVYATIADAWDHAIASNVAGVDAIGPWCWVETVEAP